MENEKTWESLFVILMCFVLLGNVAGDADDDVIDDADDDVIGDVIADWRSLIGDAIDPTKLMQADDLRRKVDQDELLAKIRSDFGTGGEGTGEVPKDEEAMTKHLPEERKQADRRTEQVQADRRTEQVQADRRAKQVQADRRAKQVRGERRGGLRRMIRKRRSADRQKHFDGVDLNLQILKAVHKEDAKKILKTLDLRVLRAMHERSRKSRALSAEFQGLLKQAIDGLENGDKSLTHNLLGDNPLEVVKENLKDALAASPEHKVIIVNRKNNKVYSNMDNGKSVDFNLQILKSVNKEDAKKMLKTLDLPVLRSLDARSRKTRELSPEFQALLKEAIAGLEKGDKRISDSFGGKPLLEVAEDLENALEGSSEDKVLIFDERTNKVYSNFRNGESLFPNVSAQRVSLETKLQNILSKVGKDREVLVLDEATNKTYSNLDPKLLLNNASKQNVSASNVSDSNVSASNVSASKEKKIQDVLSKVGKGKGVVVVAKATNKTYSNLNPKLLLNNSSKPNDSHPIAPSSTIPSGKTFHSIIPSASYSAQVTASSHSPISSIEHTTPPKRGAVDQNVDPNGCCGSVGSKWMLCCPSGITPISPVFGDSTPPSIVPSPSGPIDELEVVVLDESSNKTYTNLTNAELENLLIEMKFKDVMSRLGTEEEVVLLDESSNKTFSNMEANSSKRIVSTDSAYPGPATKKVFPPLPSVGLTHTPSLSSKAREAGQPSNQATKSASPLLSSVGHTPAASFSTQATASAHLSLNETKVNDALSKIGTEDRVVVLDESSNKTYSNLDSKRILNNSANSINVTKSFNNLDAEEKTNRETDESAKTFGNLVSFQSHPKKYFVDPGAVFEEKRIKAENEKLKEEEEEEAADKLQDQARESEDLQKEGESDDDFYDEEEEYSNQDIDDQEEEQKEKDLEAQKELSELQSQSDEDEDPVEHVFPIKELDIAMEIPIGEVLPTNPPTTSSKKPLKATMRRTHPNQTASHPNQAASKPPSTPSKSLSTAPKEANEAPTTTKTEAPTTETTTTEAPTTTTTEAPTTTTEAPTTKTEAPTTTTTTTTTAAPTTTHAPKTTTPTTTTTSTTSTTTTTEEVKLPPQAEALQEQADESNDNDGSDDASRGVAATGLLIGCFMMIYSLTSIQCA